MATRPEPVYIDDLADPVFPPSIAALRTQATPYAEHIALSTDAVVAAARHETGLEDLGPGEPAWWERMTVITTALRDEANLGPVGILSAWSQLTGLTRNRLRIADLLARHPEIHDIAVSKPIIICGLPRTGTTHLHNLLSADPALRSLPYWESLEPIPAPGEGIEERRARTGAGLDVLNTGLPYFVRMHEMTTDHVHEEIQLLAIDASSMLFETMALMPSWREYYLSHDQAPHYEYMKTVLKCLTFLRPGHQPTRWVLKSPQHLEQFSPLARVFPDATFVVTHRDPVSVTLSMGTMLAYLGRLSLAQVDPLAIGRSWAERLRVMLATAVRDRHLLPADQSIDVRFDEFMRDDMAMVARIYELAAQPLDATALAAMEAFVDDHPRGKHGTVRYDATQLGLDLPELRQQLSFYSEAFNVVDEGA
jgi:Sulfotransferase family